MVLSYLLLLTLLLSRVDTVISFSFSSEFGYAAKDKCNDLTHLPIKVDIIPSAVLSFAPFLELHHIVFLGPNNPNKKPNTGVFALDYTPLGKFYLFISCIRMCDCTLLTARVYL